MQLLYQADTQGLDADELLESLPLDPDPYAIAAVRGVHADLERIDAALEEHSTDWPVRRMPIVDRAIVRLAAWELYERLDVPTPVILDEAVELAKDYSTERSPAFVNGVLDAVARAVRTDDA